MSCPYVLTMRVPHGTRRCDGRQLYGDASRRARRGEKNDAGCQAKRVLTRECVIQCPDALAETPDETVTSEAGMVRLRGCTITVQPGYRWDGASGPTIDTPSARVGAFVHDVLYTMIRQGRMGSDKEAARRVADTEFLSLLRFHGMWRWRARIWYWCVRRFGASAVEAHE